LKTATKPTRIFLDLDDVLNQFTLYALQSVGCPVGPYEYNKFKPKWGRDIVAAANALHETKNFTVDSFWGAIDRDVWATTPRSQEANSLLHLCVELAGKENVFILSTPTLDPDCLAGKLEWIHAEMPKWIHRQYSISPRKWVCASPEAVLIDDSDENIDQWRGACGVGIVMPRPWNKLHEYTSHAYEWVQDCMTNDIFKHKMQVL
jgi:hypothetical protein